jgi:hypothetical protein
MRVIDEQQIAARSDIDHLGYCLPRGEARRAGSLWRGQRRRRLSLILAAY